MAINIIEGFYLGSSTPIDTRIVATGQSMMDQITYKYDGLRIYRTDIRAGYTWNAISLTWSADNIINGSGVSGYLPQWSNITGLTNSIIFASGSNIGINTSIYFSSNPQGSIQINGNSADPFVINSGSTNTIGSNWYGSNQVFASSNGSSYIQFNNLGNINFNVRPASGSFTNILSLSSTGNIIFNNAYSFPTTIGSVSQILQLTTGATLSWVNYVNPPLTTKGDLYGYSTVPTRIPVGTNGQVLTANNSLSLGVGWANIALPYTEYNALLTQSGNGNPVATVIYNNTGGTITWTIIDVGVYTATISGASFINGQTLILMGNNYVGGSGVVISSSWNNPTSIIIYTFDIGDNQTENGLLNSTPILIKIF